MPITYPTEIKIKTIRCYEKGESIKALSQELHISQSALYQWRNIYRSIQAPNHAYTPAEIDAISRRLQKLDYELEIIQLSGFPEKVPSQEKLAALERIYSRAENQYSIHELCEALHVARGTFYNHIFRRANENRYEDEQAQLSLKITPNSLLCSQRLSPH